MLNPSWTLLETDPEAVQKRRRKFEDWLERVVEWHGCFRFSPCQPAHFTPLRVPLSSCKVSLLTTAGVHLRTQPRFDAENPAGDSSFRWLPSGATASEFEISDIHYDHSDGDRDINCLLGVDRLRELLAQGQIGSIATHHIGLMGFIPDPAELLHTTIPEITSLLVEDRVDVALLTPG